MWIILCKTVMVNSQKNSFPQKSGQTVTHKKYYVNKKIHNEKAEIDPYPKWTNVETNVQGNGQDWKSTRLTPITPEKLRFPLLL